MPEAGCYTTRMKKHRLVVANWKMNPSTIGEAKRIFMAIRAKLKPSAVPVVIAPPAPYITELSKLSMGKRTTLGAQNIFPGKVGPHTGEVSTPMLRSLGVTHVIVGHSERRAMGETDAEVNEKTKQLLKEQIMPIVCIGETERADSGAHFETVERQLRAALAGVPKAQAVKVAVAYEPVWAISKGDGKGLTATAAAVHEMQIFIRRVLTDLFGRSSAASMRILYGGSVNADNADELISAAAVDGFLVGGASLEPKAFAAIVKAAQQ